MDRKPSVKFTYQRPRLNHQTINTNIDKENDLPLIPPRANRQFMTLSLEKMRNSIKEQEDRLFRGISILATKPPFSIDTQSRTTGSKKNNLVVRTPLANITNRQDTVSPLQLPSLDFDTSSTLQSDQVIIAQEEDYEDDRDIWGPASTKQSPIAAILYPETTETELSEPAQISELTINSSPYKMPSKPITSPSEETKDSKEVINWSPNSVSPSPPPPNHPLAKKTPSILPLPVVKHVDPRHLRGKTIWVRRAAMLSTRQASHEPDHFATPRK